MRNTLYLIRHGCTDANLAKPARLQGCRHNPPLARLGVRQAELTRDFLAVRAIDVCYCSPLHRAVETASIIAEPHGLTPQPLDELVECDVGEWEGLDWQTIRRQDPEGHAKFMAHPGTFGYPGGESFGDVHQRVTSCLEDLLSRHQGQAILVVAHHIVNRTYLAGLLGLVPDQARYVTLDNCGISVVVREEETTTVSMLNAAFHLQGVAA
jgi:broad specificity phosphatase PhoE